jgi:hypothetical protein
MAELGELLSDPIAVVGLCAFFGALIFGVLAFAFTGNYEKGGYEPVHRRPAVMEAWHREPSGEQAHLPRHRADTMEGHTTRIRGVARVSMTDSGGLTHGYHPFEAARVCEPEEEDGQEEGGADRERWEDEDRAYPHGEESRTDAPQEVNGWFKNTITGELVFFDENGREVTFES